MVTDMPNLQYRQYCGRLQPP